MYNKNKNLIVAIMHVLRNDLMCYPLLESNHIHSWNWRFQFERLIKTIVLDYLFVPLANFLLQYHVVQLGYVW